MSLYEKCKTDYSLETNGVTFEYPDIGVRVTLRRAGGANSRYVKALAKRSKDFQRAIDLGQVDNETMETILRDVFADEVIVMWETQVDAEDGSVDEAGAPVKVWKVGIEGPNGELLEFTKANVIMTLKALPVIFERIREDATRHSYYLASAREAQAKN